MNKTSIKNYAIWARNELISRVSQRAFEYGVEKDNIIPSDAESINGKLLSEDEKKKRQILVGEVKRKGYDQVIEEVAYTWFNRFIALRFMEVNNYLPDKVRLFTNENNEFKPQIIDEALHIDLLGLDKNQVILLKESNDNERLYKELLLATCNDMSRYLPGMFKPISDYMTLLFPANLLREESVLGRLISDIDEDSWTDQVQIIGWLYQYYISEKHNQIINIYKGIIKKTDIPAATQLFTPDWIVRYMTENSLGRLWVSGHSDRDLTSNWKYYLDEVEQDGAVKIELEKTKSKHANLRPEDIKFLDPCMGSGHILVYAFDVFMQIYVSEGWTEREAAKSILQNNLYGLDIDERAYQLSYFALMMKARQYNRRILSEGIIPNVMSIEESNSFDNNLLNRFGKLKSLAERVINTFVDAKEYGSILDIKFKKEEIDLLATKLKEIDKMADYGNLLDQIEADQLCHDFYPLLKQAKIMSQRYDCVVTNPPYLGKMDNTLKQYVLDKFKDYCQDLFSVFMKKSFELTREGGYIGMMTPFVWMFLKTYEKLRKYIINEKSITSLIQMEYSSFEEATVPICSFVLANDKELVSGKYIRLSDFKGGMEVQKEKTLEAINDRNCGFYYQTSAKVFTRIPGYSIAYWLSKNYIRVFNNSIPLEKVSYSFQGIITGDNEIYLRMWHEPSFTLFNREIKSFDEHISNVWVPYNKGGDYRKWYGNNNYVLKWVNDGKDLTRSRIENSQYHFVPGVTWTSISSGDFSCRYYGYGFLSDSKGSSIYAIREVSNEYICGFMNSKVVNEVLKATNPTISYQVMNILALPYIRNNRHEIIENLVRECIKLSKSDWDSFETSWDFKKHPLVRGKKTVKESFTEWEKECFERFGKLKANEESLNDIFIDIYGLNDEMTSEVEDKDITVRKGNLQREIKSLISYAVGCMFGRYSLDVDGLAYAGGEWDDSKYKSFIPDKDNIIPICDDEYFNDDITGRFIEFIKAAYGEDTLEENLRFIADALGGKGASREVIRNYFINDFYKDHCNTYQVTGSGKRPIYWQFDSGKKNGFKALVYIHRYTPDLIARMRTSYVHEQQSRYENQISMIQNRIDSATSTSERVKAEKELKQLKEQADELRVYEEKIHHWADKMEPMDLDDGVKANYAKFQELLTKIK